MKRKISILLVICMIFTMIPAMAFAEDTAEQSANNNTAVVKDVAPNSAGEDNTAPKLVYVEILDTNVSAGEPVKIKIKVKEEGTGLTSAFFQLNHSKTDDVGPIAEKVWAEPVFSSGSDYIVYTATLPTTKSTKSGDWFIAYLELIDAKGNFSRYDGNTKDNTMHSDFNESEPKLEGVTHVNIYGTTGDTQAPKLNWIKIVDKTVEKPGKVQIQANITEPSGLSYVQIDMKHRTAESGSGSQYYDLPKKKSTDTYTFEVSISKNKKSGEWELFDLYLDDTKGNSANYTTLLIPDSFVNYDDPEECFAVPTFYVSGVAGDETDPAVTDIKILNDGKLVQKPGVLEFSLDLVEVDSGITNIEVEIECISSDNQDVKSQVLYRFSAEGHSYGKTSSYSGDIGETMYAQPLMTGTYKFRMPVPSTIQNGTYRIHVRELIDKAENIYADYADKMYGVEFTVEDEFDYAYEVGIGNAGLLDKVNSMAAGEVGRIMLKSSEYDNILPKEVLDSIAGQDKTLVCYREGYQWIIRGLDISADKTKDLNLTTKIYSISKGFLSSNQKAVGIRFKDNGELPGIIQFRFKSAFIKNYVGNEKKLKLYYVDEADEQGESIDFINDNYERISNDKANIEVVADNNDAWCYVDIAHNSNYIISSAAIKGLTMKNAAISGLSNKYTYNNKYKKPEVKIKIAGKTLVKNQDYKLTYKNNKKVGKAAITVTGIGKYKKLGSRTINFIIVPKAPASVSAKLKSGTDGYDDVRLTWSKVTGATGYTVYYKRAGAEKYSYMTRTAKTSAVKTKLAKGKKYVFKVVPYYKTGGTRYGSLSYKTASVYTLKKVELSSFSRSNGKVKVAWKNINGETGYQISQSTKKSGTKIVATYKTTKGKTKLIKAKKGKGYWYKVRAYKYVGKSSSGKALYAYGPWSAPKLYKR